MSFHVNFSTHGKDLNNAYQAVISEQDDTNWLIYAYDKGTYDLRVQATGDGGLEELNDEFSDGKVQFAYAKVIDPNTELPKFVFVGWCGSGVPELRKAFFNSQLSEVSKFFKSFHVQINARDEADVEPDLIMKRVAESSGANYSVHKESAKPQPKIAPVGSVYKKTEIPNIAAMQKQSMTKENAPKPVGTSYVPVQTAPKKLEQRWNASQNQDSGANAVRAERERFEKEVREREVQRTKESQFNARAESEIAAKREQEEAERRQREDENEQRRLQDAARQREEYQRQQDEERRREQERREQEEEEQNRRYAEEQEERQRQDAYNRQQQEDEQRRAEEEDRQRRAEEDRRRQQEEADRRRQQQEEEERLEQERLHQEEAARQAEAQLNQSAQRAVETSQAASASVVNPTHHDGVSAVVMFEYDASESNEMTLVEGEVITQIDQVDEGWWFGVSEDGKKQGLFPANYVQIIEEPVHEEPAAPANIPPPPAPPQQQQQKQEDLGNVAVALYDYEADEENEITFAEGDTITHIEFVSDDWWQGSNGKSVGLFPANYVELKQ